MKIWKIGIYARVSTDNNDQKESIPAQIQSMREWVIKKSNEDKDNIYEIIKTYEDLGCSGSDFHRESFIRMKGDIEAGIINMVVTRDLSRFGRNYLMAGYYLEDYFKINNVRFISILDQVDTITEINDIVPFKNLLNEMYIKDCSRRSRDGLKQRMKRGSCISSKPPYGYIREIIEENNQKTIRLVPANDETTEVVKSIYHLYLQGYGYAKIAGILNKENIPPPASRLNFPLQKRDLWTPNSIKSILTNYKYGGDMVQGQHTKLSYKIKKVVKVPEEDWISGGSFRGIIEPEIFNEVQEQMRKRVKSYRYKGSKAHIFSGILICNECGSTFVYVKKYQGYKCANSQNGSKKCTAHSIKEEFLLKTIREELKKQSAPFHNKLYEECKAAFSENETDIELQLKRVVNELSRLEYKFNKLYEDRLEGLISESNFENFSSQLQKKQKVLQDRKEELQKKQEKANTAEADEKLQQKIDEFLEYRELTREDTGYFIEKIIVTQDPGTNQKRLDIFYKFREAGIGTTVTDSL